MVNSTPLSIYKQQPLAKAFHFIVKFFTNCTKIHCVHSLIVFPVASKPPKATPKVSAKTCVESVSEISVGRSKR